MCLSSILGRSLQLPCRTAWRVKNEPIAQKGEKPIIQSLKEAQELKGFERALRGGFKGCLEAMGVGGSCAACVHHHTSVMTAGTAPRKKTIPRLGARE